MKREGNAECVHYFKANAAYKRAFQAMKKQWQKYGRLAGWIVLPQASPEEKAALQAVLGTAFAGERIRFKMQEFQAALRETKYAAVELPELLAAYFGETLLTHKAEREQAREQKAGFFAQSLAALQRSGDYAEAPAAWLALMAEEKSAGYQLVLAEYEKDPAAAQQQIFSVVQAVNYLTGLAASRVRLAVLGAEITANPHYFDRSQSAGRLLLYALSYIKRRQYPKDAESILELYFLAGIRSDDISSFTTAYNIALYTEQGLHPAYAAFEREQEAFMINLSGLERIVRADAAGKRVFIVENQMVFSTLCEMMQGQHTAILCTSGQMKTASLLLLDLLCQAGCRLYYSGDFDPEGLLIADRLLARHPGQILPWHFTAADYEICRSQEDITASRLKQLEKVKNGVLRQTAAKLLQTKKSGYQEKLLEKLQADMAAPEKMELSLPD